MFGTLVSLFLAITIPAFYLFGVGGIWRDVPELGVTAALAEFAPFSKKPNPNIIYNSRIYDFDKDFTANNRKKVLVIGNSFSHDFVNVLLESSFRDSIQLSYVVDIYTHPQVQQRLNQANYIFFSKIDYSQLLDYMQKCTIDTQKVKNVGTKNFGTNNGIYYNNQKDTSYCSQRTAMEIWK